MSQINKVLFKSLQFLLAFLILVSTSTLEIQAKIIKQQFFNDGYGDMPYATGERAIVTVRGARNPWDGSAPRKIIIEDDPYRGPLPIGPYGRLDGGRMPYGGYGMGGGYPGMGPYPMGSYNRP